MQSKTSFFNKTLFAKSLSRFWPLWFAYFALWFLFMPLQLADYLRYFSGEIHSLQITVMERGFVGSLLGGGIMGVASAMAVCSFMYSSRSAHGIACLPIKREGVFLSHAAAGALPVIAANALIVLCTLGVEALYETVDLGSLAVWFGLNCLAFLFFYGFALFCAQLTGSILVLPVVYAVLNFTAVVVEIILRMIISCFVYGLRSDVDYLTAPLSPVVQYILHCGVENVHDYTPAGEYIGISRVFFRGWGVYAAYAAVGLVFIALALLLYRRRHMETAGDVVAVRVLKPVFKYCLTFGCALVLGYVLSMFITGLSADGTGGIAMMLVLLVCMLIGAFIGYFAAEMLNRKSFRVFRGSWKGLGISALIIVVLMFSLEYDVFGLERWTPKAEKVDSVTVSCNGEAVQLYEKENIDSAIALHKSIIENKDHYENISNARPLGSHRYMNFYYEIGGRIVERSYYVYVAEEDSPGYADTLAAQEILNSTEAIAFRKNFDKTVFTPKNIDSFTVSATLPAADCARIAGCADVGSWLLYERSGFSAQEIERMTEAERESLIIDIAIGSCMGDKYYDYVGFDGTVEIYGSEFEISLENLDELYFEYTWYFSGEEAMDLLYNCIVPDISDGTIGKIWLLTDDNYRENVFAATIRIEAAAPAVDTNGREYTTYQSFYTTPTAVSARTNAWLADHGVEMYLIKELEK